MSSLSWLDTSSREHRRALEAIRLLAEPGTVDELGLGTVRDSLADQLFPGTSTIQTRARYFLFIPWTYQIVERSRRADSAAKLAREIAVRLIDAIGDVPGNIGREARSRLRRLPSAIYWQGLGRLRIRRFAGSVDRLHRVLDGQAQMVQALLDDSREPILGGYEGHWHPGLPPAPKAFPRDVTLDLTGREADYLRERIVTAAPSSAFAHWVQAEAPDDQVGFPWDAPRARSLPVAARDLLEHARCFSELMLGAALLYNLLLAQKRGDSELEADYTGRLGEWSGQIARRRAAHDRWELREFWQHVRNGNPRFRDRTRVFIEQWHTLAMAGPGSVARSERARRLIADREQALKGHLARLSNPRQLELWRGASGTGQMDYRWGDPVQTMVREILEALAQ
ncbi:MAG: hypothetical protein IT347_09605 [Candidatus Eisenbacteria bacterium]|nr:hypothetical protein [Candidatus Eisenbacteria bacterium]